jgi:hypothetical protein
MNFEIRGDRQLADIGLTETINLKGKVEQIFSQVVSTDGDLNIDFDKIGTISKIIVQSPKCYLKIGTTDNVRTIPISGLFVYSLENVFANALDTIAVGAIDTTPVTIFITIIGV